ncbi:metallophosphoesterase [Bacillus thermotolerans]|uniref:Phosphoesterase n=1 Tax=Bacillus thermotolerans TaxID=1221996 RepID=A0A0F5HQ22_BACTR|nr:metallophosphoesterase [Bacillus thermotolerans]KKB35120.1 phosphoesterase [Bacillus thermotolerans]KKB43381.1 phosphoesterase [Bacillus thermotolerans]KKB43498.1 phosphoesterase [Bacillus thermotolerans]
MKALIVSDSHSETDILEDLKGRYADEADVLIHCGDSELSDDHPAINGYLVVRGNCDAEDEFPYDVIEGVGGRRIFITHGHRYNVKMTLMNLSYKAEEYGADFVFFGHSHIPGAEKIGETIFLNPGSIAVPRGSDKKTYALIEDNKREVSIRFFDDSHKELPHLSCTFLY